MAEAAGAYLLYGFFYILPLDTASDLGGFLLRRIGPRMGITRTAQRNLARAFPEKTEEEKQAIIAGMWDNLGRVIAEYPHLRRIWPRVEFIGEEHMIAARDSGRPVIFFGGHIGNWEINALSARQVGLDAALVYRRPNNPYVDGLLCHARASGADQHIPKGAEGARAMLSILKKKGAIGMLADQKLNEGVAVPFFGQAAMTAPAIAQFALRLGCDVYPAVTERLGGARFRFTVFPRLHIENTGDKEGDALRVLTDINAQLEIWIRKNPSQWLWIHRRWPD
jgi:KDO2-lipid IV(A) lauroyltransferase